MNNIKSTDSNLHLSMLADPTKIDLDNVPTNNFDFSNSDEHQISIESIKSKHQLTDSDDIQPNNNNNNLFNEHEFSNINNFQHGHQPKAQTPFIPKHNSENISEISEHESSVSNNKYNNINAKEFNIDPETIPFERLDSRTQKFKKMEKLAKLIELKNRGYSLTKNYNMESSYDEMCFEIDFWSNHQKKKDGVELGKSFLMNAVTALEFLNDRYDPFSFKLDGWSEQVKMSSDSYTDVFGELYDKYKSTGKKIEPEIKLLLMLSASAVTFHASKAITDKAPIIGNILKQNPNLVSQFTDGINNNISGSKEEDKTYNMREQELFNSVKNQQSNIMKSKKNNLSSILSNLKEDNSYSSSDSDNISISNSSKSMSERKKAILKINTK